MPRVVCTLSLHDALPICSAGKNSFAVELTPRFLARWRETREAREDQFTVILNLHRGYVEQPQNFLPTKAPMVAVRNTISARSEEHTSELQSRLHLVCRLL